MQQFYNPHAAVDGNADYKMDYSGHVLKSAHNAGHPSWLLFQPLAIEADQYQLPRHMEHINHQNDPEIVYKFPEQFLNSDLNTQGHGHNLLGRFIYNIIR